MKYTDNNSPQQQFDRLRSGILACRVCEPRFGFEPAPVFFGHLRARIMQISQAPSATVHRTGKPFNDLSGQRLRGSWYQISDETFYNEDNFYISSLAHCFPGKTASGGDKAPPACCAKMWLDHEIELIENSIYVVIGGMAAKYLFPGQDYTELIFSDNTLRGKPAYVMPHPSPLNVKWFIDHPAFEAERMPQIRRAVWEALGISGG